MRKHVHDVNHCWLCSCSVAAANGQWSICSMLASSLRVTNSPAYLWNVRCVFVCLYNTVQITHCMLGRWYGRVFSLLTMFAELAVAAHPTTISSLMVQGSCVDISTGKHTHRTNIEHTHRGRQRERERGKRARHRVSILSIIHCEHCGKFSVGYAGCYSARVVTRAYARARLLPAELIRMSPRCCHP